MTTKPKRGGPRPGAGQKPKDPSGEPMKPHAMRWTDAGWADVLLIGMDRMRELVRQEAERVRGGTSAIDKADAKRFRWLLEGNGYFMEEEWLCGPGRGTEEDKDHARRTIDAAMSG